MPLATLMLQCVICHTRPSELYIPDATTTGRCCAYELACLACTETGNDVLKNGQADFREVEDYKESVTDVFH